MCLLWELHVFDVSNLGISSRNHMDTQPHAYPNTYELELYLTVPQLPKILYLLHVFLDLNCMSNQVNHIPELCYL